MLLLLVLVIVLLALGGGIFWHPVIFALLAVALVVYLAGRPRGTL